MIEIAVTAALLAVGYLFGGRNEKKHIEALRQREQNLLSMPATNLSGPQLTTGETFLVTGSVVIASDYFKNFIGAIKNLIGGGMSTHETLLDRARREAVCRMKENAKKKGANSVIDVHIETSFLDQLGVEVSAYGTAVK